MRMILRSKLAHAQADVLAEQTRNYLQSPYYFMCCNLWDVSEDRPAQADSQSALAGTVVSSLHRLKDTDNSGTSGRVGRRRNIVIWIDLSADGGFFVFGDLSVKIEGVFRLRFQLFEVMQ